MGEELRRINSQMTTDSSYERGTDQSFRKQTAALAIVLTISTVGQFLFQVLGDAIFSEGVDYDCVDGSNLYLLNNDVAFFFFLYTFGLLFYIWCFWVVLYYIPLKNGLILDSTTRAYSLDIRDDDDDENGNTVQKNLIEEEK